MAKILKSLKLKGMKQVKIFLIFAIFAAGCHGHEDDADLDAGLEAVDEFDTSHLAGDPAPSPYEFLIKETASVEGECPINLN